MSKNWERGRQEVEQSADEIEQSTIVEKWVDREILKICPYWQAALPVKFSVLPKSKGSKVNFDVNFMVIFFQLCLSFQETKIETSVLGNLSWK